MRFFPLLATCCCMVQNLTCVLMDYDDFNPDDEIGRCVLPLKELTNETQDFWLDIDMEADNAADNSDGGPKVSVRFYDFELWSPEIEFWA
jgi:hypothetical protein